MTYIPDRKNQEFNTDAGGRTRVSQITTLFDGKTLGADDPFLWENVGTGTGTWANNKYSMSVTSGQYRIRRGRHVIPYFSGKSELIETTFDGFQTQANTTKRVGYFSSNAIAPYDTSLDGFFVENDGTTIRLKAYRFGTETINVPWTSWDAYSEISGYDWSLFTIVVFDFLWLGGSELNVYLKDPINGGFIRVHRHEWAGTGDDTFIGSPNHSVRYEMRSSTGTGSFRPICAQSSTEGSISEAGEKLSIINLSAITTNTVGTIYALKGLKKTATYRDTKVSITGISVANTGTADAGILMLLLNPTLSAAITYTNNSRISEGTPTNQTVTSTGRVLLAVPATAIGTASQLDDNYLASVGMGIDNTSDELVLAYMPVTTNQSVYGIITVKES